MSGLVRLIVAAAVIWNGIGGAAGGEERVRCAPGQWRGWKASLTGTHEASANLYNAALWGIGTAAVGLGAEPPGDARWTATNDFDDEIRRALRASSRSGRRSADLASDFTLGASLALPLAGLGVTWYEGSCDEAFGMLAEFAESALLASLLTETAKVVAARERPFGVDCPGCSGSDSRRSFFSGHSSLAAAGAGVVCSYSIRRRTWGDEVGGRVVPCALGVSTALATGLLRIAADEHWATDVITGWAVGGLIGFFDVPGPFDLLRFSVPHPGEGDDAEGILLPYAGQGRAGVQVAIRF